MLARADSPATMGAKSPTADMNASAAGLEPAFFTVSFYYARGSRERTVADEKSKKTDLRGQQVKADDKGREYRERDQDAEGETKIGLVLRIHDGRRVRGGHATSVGVRAPADTDVFLVLRRRIHQIAVPLSASNAGDRPPMK